MAGAKKPSAVELMTFFIKRRENALTKRDQHRELGNLGQQIYWHTAAVDAGLILGWISGDEYWTFTARRDSSDLEELVAQLDTERAVAALPEPVAA